MPKQGKSPKKKTKEKSPQRTEESEYPAMDQETYNRLLKNAIEHSKAELQQQLQQQHEEQLKAVERRRAVARAKKHIDPALRFTIIVNLREIDGAAKLLALQLANTPKKDASPKYLRSLRYQHHTGDTFSSSSGEKFREQNNRCYVPWA